MKDKLKTKTQLIAELEAFRARVAALANPEPTTRQPAVRRATSTNNVDPFFDSSDDETGSVNAGIDQTGPLRPAGSQTLISKLLEILNRPGNLQPLIGETIALIKEATGFDAVGLRIRRGEDYPYYEFDGFSQEFIREENPLCKRDRGGAVVRDTEGRPRLDCTCGLVLSGRVDPKMPCFTKGGSFWTNASGELLVVPPEADPRANPRNRCIHAGYQSIGLFPLRSGSKIIGLLQLNDHRQDRFTPEGVAFFENLAQNIGLAVKRAAAEEALQEREALYRRLFEDNELVNLIIDPESGAIVDANSAACIFYRYDKKAFLKKNIADLNVLAPEQVFGEIKRAKYAKKRCSVFQHRLANGEIRDVEVYSTAIRISDNDLLYAIIHDITERRLAEEKLKAAHHKLEQRVKERTKALQEANEKLRLEIKERMAAQKALEENGEMLQTIFDGISEPLVMLDKHMFVVILNEAAREYYDIMDYQAIIGRPCWEVFREGPVQCRNCRVPESFSKNKRVVFERKGFRDPARLERVTTYPLRGENGGGGGCIVQISDITEQKKLEKQLIRADRLSSLGQLSGGIAHEIRNPLSGINLFVDILMDEDKFQRTEEEINVFNDIKSDIRKIDGIIKMVLDFARESNGAMTEVDLNSLINENLKLWYAKMRKAAIKLELSFQKGPLFVRGDVIGLGQVVNNLIQNAIDAMSAGGTLSISTRTRASSYNEERPVVVVDVRDTGSGISPELHDKIYNPFFTTKAAGTGLGLSISNQIIQRHGGVLSYKSNSGALTTFTVELPILDSRDSEQ